MFQNIYILNLKKILVILKFIYIYLNLKLLPNKNMFIHNTCCFVFSTFIYLFFSFTLHLQFLVYSFNVEFSRGGGALSPLATGA